MQRSIAEKICPVFEREPQEIDFLKVDKSEVSFAATQSMIVEKIQRDADLLEPVIEKMCHI